MKISYGLRAAKKQQNRDIPNARLSLVGPVDKFIYRNSSLKPRTFVCIQVFKFLDGRSHRAHLLKRNPRKVTWTVLYRRKHNKGIEAETSKKRTKRTQKFQRAVVGATLQDIMAKRNQKPEVRKAQREQAIR